MNWYQHKNKDLKAMPAHWERFHDLLSKNFHKTIEDLTRQRFKSNKNIFYLPAFDLQREIKSKRSLLFQLHTARFNQPLFFIVDPAFAHIMIHFQLGGQLKHLSTPDRELTENDHQMMIKILSQLMTSISDALHEVSNVIGDRIQLKEQLTNDIEQQFLLKDFAILNYEFIIAESTFNLSILVMAEIYE